MFFGGSAKSHHGAPARPTTNALSAGIPLLSLLALGDLLVAVIGVRCIHLWKGAAAFFLFIRRQIIKAGEGVVRRELFRR